MSWHEIWVFFTFSSMLATSLAYSMVKKAYLTQVKSGQRKKNPRGFDDEPDGCFVTLASMVSFGNLVFFGLAMLLEGLEFLPFVMKYGAGALTFGVSAFLLASLSERYYWSEPRLARYRAKHLLKIIPEENWSGMRSQISALANRSVPELASEISRLNSQIARVKALGLQDFSSEAQLELAVRTEDNLRVLESERERAVGELEDCLYFLDHVEGDLYVARYSTEKREDVSHRLLSLIGGIEATVENSRRALAEVPDLEPPSLARIASATSDKDSA